MASKKTEQAEVVDLSDIQKQIADMLAEAKAEAARIVAEAKANMNKPTDEEADRRRAEAFARGEELVEIELFKDSGKYKDDVFVSVNGETIAIQRGERVAIKRKFADVLQNSMLQDRETARIIDQKSSEWATNARKLM